MLKAYSCEFIPSTPWAENAGTDTLAGTERTEVEEVSVRFPLTGIAHRIRMQISLGGFDQPAQPREGNVVACLHRGTLRDQGELDFGWLRDAPPALMRAFSSRELRCLGTGTRAASTI